MFHNLVEIKGHHHWELYNRRREIIAISPPYSSKSNAKRALQSFANTLGKVPPRDWRALPKGVEPATKRAGPKAGKPQSKAKAAPRGTRHTPQTQKSGTAAKASATRAPAKAAAPAGSKPKPKRTLRPTKPHPKPSARKPRAQKEPAAVGGGGPAKWTGKKPRRKTTKVTRVIKR